MKINKHLDKIKDYWSLYLDPKKSKKRVANGMSGLGLMHSYYNFLVSGDRKKHYLEYFKEKYLDGKRWDIASLGCGDGHLERELVKMEYPYSSIHGFDINPNLVNFANSEVVRLGINALEYNEMDLNEPSFSRKYDLIIFFHSLHHVEDLENCLDRASKALSSNGLILLVDFVGPTKFQWTNEQIKYSQDMLDILSAKLKINQNSINGGLKTSISRPSIKDVENADPSEAVRSGDILGCLERKFTILEYKPMGGTLLNLLFSDIAANFDEKDPDIVSLILSFQKFEETLIEKAIISSDFVFAVLKNK